MKTITIRKLKIIARRLTWGIATVAALPALAGCGHGKETTAENEPAELRALSGDQFRPDDELRPVHRIADASAASGARNDATLHAFHFDGGNAAMLNSLGEQKLDLMLADDDALPLVVYLDVPQDDVAARRQEAIQVFLKDRGVLATQFKVVPGKNMQLLTATAPKIKAMQSAEAAAPAAAAPANGVPTK